MFIFRVPNCSLSKFRYHGLQSLVWRHQWEETKNDEFKQKLLTYNIEDCLATQVVAQANINGLLRNAGESQLKYLLAEDIKTDAKKKRFQDTKFLFEEMDYIKPTVCPSHDPAKMLSDQ